MKMSTKNTLRAGLIPGLLIAVLAGLPLVSAAEISRSDVNRDGMVDSQDLDAFASTYLEQDWETVDWCTFYGSTAVNPKYFRKVTSDNSTRYRDLMTYIAATYDCKAVTQSGDKSDLNGDGVVDLDDLALSLIHI